MEDRDFAYWSDVPGGHAPLILQGPTLDRLSRVLPKVTVQVRPDSGHFRSLARQERFTRCPAVTAQRGKTA